VVAKQYETDRYTFRCVVEGIHHGDITTERTIFFTPIR
jgi:hypothetical protein